MIHTHTHTPLILAAACWLQQPVAFENSRRQCRVHKENYMEKLYKTFVGSRSLYYIVFWRPLMARTHSSSLLMLNKLLH